MPRFSRFIFLFLLTGSGFGQQAAPAVPFTLADRDRILRTEQRIVSLSQSVDERFDALSQSVDERFEGVQRQLDTIFNLMLFLLGGIMGLIGFVLYDRKTILKPVTRKQEAMERALIAYSEKNKALKESLKKAGIL